MVPKQPSHPLLITNQSSGSLRALQLRSGNVEKLKCVGQKLTQQQLLQSVYLFDGRTTLNEKVSYVEYRYPEENEAALLTELRRRLPDYAKYSVIRLTPHVLSE